MVTPCTTTALIQCATQLRFTITLQLYSYKSHWNANISGTLNAMSLCTLWEDLVPCIQASPFVVNWVNMFLHQCHQVKFLQLLYLGIKVILILAAECGRVPSPKVYSSNHSHVISDSLPFTILCFFLIRKFFRCFDFQSVIIIFSLFLFVVIISVIMFRQCK